MYLMMGDGGGVGGDPYNFSQNKKSLLGKIMRLDVDNIPSKPQQRLLYSGFEKMIYLHKLELLSVLFSYALICFQARKKSISLASGETTLPLRTILLEKTQNCSQRYGL